MEGCLALKKREVLTHAALWLSLENIVLSEAVCVFVCVCVCVHAHLVSQSCLTLCDPMNHSPLLGPWNSPGKNTGVGNHSLLQGIFLTQGSNSCLLYWQASSFPLNCQGRPEIYVMCT